MPSRTVRYSLNLTDALQSVNASSYTNRTCAFRGTVQADGGPGKLEYDYCDIAGQGSYAYSDSYTKGYPPECPQANTACLTIRDAFSTIRGRSDGMQPAADGTAWFSLVADHGQGATLYKATVAPALQAEMQEKVVTYDCCEASHPPIDKSDEKACGACDDNTDCALIYANGGGAPYGMWVPETLTLGLDPVELGVWREKKVQHDATNLKPGEAVIDTEVIRWRVDPE
jgi:hypothetical protein